MAIWTVSIIWILDCRWQIDAKILSCVVHCSQACSSWPPDLVISSALHSLSNCGFWTRDASLAAETINRHHHVVVDELTRYLPRPFLNPPVLICGGTDWPVLGRKTTKGAAGKIVNEDALVPRLPVCMLLCWRQTLHVRKQAI